MKKVFAGILIGVILSTGIMVSGAAVTKLTAIQEAYSSTVFGKLFKPAKPIVTINNDVYVPLKLLADSMGIKCTIDAKTKKITIGEPSKATLIEFSNYLISYDGTLTTVKGEIKNNNVKKHTLGLRVSFFDSAGKLLGSTIGFVNDLEPGETKTFETMGAGDFTTAAKYKVQIDSMF